MGWSSAGHIFDPVARALIEAGVDGPTKRKVLGDLIKGLQDGDWDTEDESLELFLDDPDVVAAFADRGVTLAADPDAVLAAAQAEVHELRGRVAVLEKKREAANARAERLHDVWERESAEKNTALCEARAEVEQLRAALAAIKARSSA